MSVCEWTREPPDVDGWWLFREDGMSGTQLQRMLVIGGEVAGDDEWEQEIGRAPSSLICENYWEGNHVNELTDGRLTRGSWKLEKRIYRHGGEEVRERGD